MKKFLLPFLICAAVLSAANFEGIELSNTGELQDKDMNALVEKLRAYKIGGDRSEVLELIQLAEGTADQQKQVLSRMVSLIGDKKTSEDARIFLINMLGVAGAEEQIGLISGYLLDKDEKLNFAASSALEQLGGKNAMNALLQTLPKSDAAQARHILAALQSFKNPDAVPALVKVLESSKDRVALGLSLQALAAIASEDANKAIVAYGGKVSPELRGEYITALSSSLISTRGIASAKTRQAAIAQLMKMGDRPYVKQFALVEGLYDASTDELIKNLGSSDEALRNASLTVLTSGSKKIPAATLLALLPKLEEGMTVRLLPLLKGQADDSAIPLLSKYAQGGNPLLKEQALEIIGSINSEASLTFLFEEASENPSPAVEKALDGTTTTMIPQLRDQLNTTNTATVALAIRQLVRLEDRTVVPQLISRLESADRDFATTMLAAIGSLGDANAVMPLLNSKTKAGQERLRAAISNIYARYPQEVGKVFDSNWSSLSPANKVQLVEIYGARQSGEDLRKITALLGDSDATVKAAAIRVLGSWKNSEPLNALLDFTSTQKELREQVLSLRAIGSLLERAQDLSPEARKAAAAKAQSMATRDEEKQIFQSLL